jgi:hypothetical protein
VLSIFSNFSIVVCSIFVIASGPGPKPEHRDKTQADVLTYKTEVCRTHITTGHCDYG